MSTLNKSSAQLSQTELEPSAPRVVNLGGQLSASGLRIVIVQPLQ